MSLLTADSPEVVEFVAAYQENANLALGHLEHITCRIVAETRRKYILIDEIDQCDGRDCAGRSGRFMVDRATGRVFTIRGYGQRHRPIGTLAGLAAEYRKGSATFNPTAGAHWVGRDTRVASWPTRRLA
jgi:hypothetical protein